MGISSSIDNDNYQYINIKKFNDNNGSVNLCRLTYIKHKEFISQDWKGFDSKKIILINVKIINYNIINQKKVGDKKLNLNINKKIYICDLKNNTYIYKNIKKTKEFYQKFALFQSINEIKKLMEEDDIEDTVYQFNKNSNFFKFYCSMYKEFSRSLYFKPEQNYYNMYHKTPPDIIYLNMRALKDLKSWYNNLLKNLSFIDMNTIKINLEPKVFNMFLEVTYIQILEDNSLSNFKIESF